MNAFGIFGTLTLAATFAACVVLILAGHAFLALGVMVAGGLVCQEIAQAEDDAMLTEIEEIESRINR